MPSPAPLEVRVVEVVRETPDAHTLVLEPVTADPAALHYRPGQFLTVRVPTDRPGGAARCYSLSSSPLIDEHLRITVKRTPGGYGSNWICDHVVAGDTLHVLPPAGTFTPDSLDDDLLLLVAGSGITPAWSILTSCLRGGTGNVTLLYANRDEHSVIFRDALVALAGQYGDRLTVVHWLESVQGVPTRSGLRAVAAPCAGRQAFVCGPGPFMDLARAALDELGFPAERFHAERFTSLSGDPFAPQERPEPVGGPLSTVEVMLDGEVTDVPWPRDSSLLDALLRAGVDAPSSCREGNCSACACLLVEGEATMTRNDVLDARDLADGLLLACQAHPVSERLKVTYDG